MLGANKKKNTEKIIFFTAMRGEVGENILNSCIIKYENETIYIML